VTTVRRSVEGPRLYRPCSSTVVAVDILGVLWTQLSFVYQYSGSDSTSILRTIQSHDTVLIPIGRACFGRAVRLYDDSRSGEWSQYSILHYVLIAESSARYS